MASFLANSFGCILKFGGFLSANVSKTGRYFGLKSSGLTKAAVCRRWIHLTWGARGIEEFFPPGALETGEPLPEEIPSGRSWRTGELRQKSNEDLHKLWYVLLKERNMLLTVQWEARRQEVVMPSPERLHKVKKSMAMIKVVLGERQRAIEDIERRAKEKQLLGQSLTGMDNELHQEIRQEHKGFNEQSDQAFRHQMTVVL